MNENGDYCVMACRNEQKDSFGCVMGQILYKFFFVKCKVIIKSDLQSFISKSNELRAEPGVVNLKERKNCFFHNPKWQWDPSYRDGNVVFFCH